MCNQTGKGIINYSHNLGYLYKYMVPFVSDVIRNNSTEVSSVYLSTHINSRIRVYGENYKKDEQTTHVTVIHCGRFRKQRGSLGLSHQLRIGTKN